MSLFLRRVTVNGSPPEEESNHLNIISLENQRTTFGKHATSDVSFVHGKEGDEKDVPYIHKNHAHIVRSVTADGNPKYTLYDHSDSGTYVDDERVVKSTGTELRSQSVLRFGHENPDDHPHGVKKSDPRARFSFLIETTKTNVTVVPKLQEAKDRRVRVFSMDMVVKDLGVRIPPGISVPRPQIVPQKNGIQQREADSTMTADEHGTLPSTSSSSTVSSESPESVASTSTASTSKATTAKVAPEEIQSTSWNSSEVLLNRAPRRAPHTQRFDDPRNIGEQQLNRPWIMVTVKLEAQLRQLRRQIPHLAPVDPHFLKQMLGENVACDHTTAAGKETFIEEFCAKHSLRREQDAKLVLEKKSEIAEFLVADEAGAGVAMQGYTDRAIEFQAQFNVPVRPNPFYQSPSSAFRPASQHPQQEPQQEPTQSLPSNICRPTPLHPLYHAHEYYRFLTQLSGILPPDMQQLVNGPYLPFTMETYQRLHLASHHHYAGQMHAQQPVPGNYLNGLHRSLELVPDGAAQQHGGVIAKAPGPRRNDHQEEDEERHSASSGSTTDNNYNGRRRTASEESEIVDVVGMEDEEDDAAKASTAENTPTPSPPEEAQKKRVEEPEEDETSSSTPRIDAQSTPSAVVSAVPSAVPSAAPTPLSSPVPKKAAPGSSLHSPKLPEVAPTTSAAAQEPESPETIQKKVEENVASIKATMSVVAKTPAASTSTSSTSTASVSVTVAATPSDAKKKTPAAKERRMKQLDDASSADSESEDDETKKTKKSGRRPGRAAPGTARRRKAAAANADAEGSEEARDAEVSTAGSSGSSGKSSPKTPAGRRKAVAKQKVEETGLSARRKRKGDAEGHEEASPRKRRVTKKQAAEDDDSAAGVDDSSDKEKCGVAKTHCLCKKLEKKKDLQWVSCSKCDQWFHVWCVRLDNNGYGEDDKFQCCGDDPSPEAVRCLGGLVNAEYKSMLKTKKPILPE